MRAVSYFLGVFNLVIMSFGCSADLAQRCAEQFPCRDSVVVTQQIRIDTAYAGPWMFVDTDTVPCPPSDSGTLIVRRDTIRIPVQKTVFKYEYLDTCHITSNTAYEAQLQQKINQLSKELKARQNEVNRERERVAASRAYKWISWLLIAALVAALGYIITRSLKFRI